jgi:glycosyltransferase involved in cell wall biosynthesis
VERERCIGDPALPPTYVNTGTPLRVAQIMAGAPQGGAELFYERLCFALHAAGDAVLPVIRREPGRAGRLSAAGLAPVELGFGNPLDLLTGPRLAAALRRFAPRVAIAWMSRAARFAPRGDWVLCGRLGGYYDLRNFRRCDHLIANTHALVKWITAQGWPEARAHYLPNFVVDMAAAAPAPRGELGVPDGAPLLLGLGRLHANKAFDVLIRALPRLPGVYAVIAGEGPERGALESLARAEGVADRVRLPGWRGDAANLLAAADLFVCSSRQEPLGNMVIEAWSARRPVVAAAVGGPAELIEADRTGLLVPPDDPASLAAAIGRVLDDAPLGIALAEAGRARYEAAFAQAPVVAQWRAFLARVEKA